jgi:hypothetical protein
MNVSCPWLLLAVMAPALIASQHVMVLSSARSEPSTIELGDCKSDGRTKTCALRQSWGTQTTYFDSDVPETGGGKFPGITGAELVFDNVRSDPSGATIAIGRFMLAVLPGSTPAQCDALISKVYIASFEKSDVTQYGWRWNVKPGADPVNMMVFTARRENRGP